MRVLIFGGGAREHAITLKISQSPILTKLYLVNPNDGFSHLGQVLEYENFEDLAKKSLINKIDLLIVGPEQPLVDGIADIFSAKNIPVIGVNKKWAKLESSKIFAKEFMLKNHIPTAKYKIIDKNINIDAALADFNSPFVIKADGLAAGKGVSIVKDLNVAKSTIQEYLSGKFGKASKRILMEEFLEGEEISLMSIWDGKILLPFISAKDFKKLSADMDAPNTGGMGAYCPVKLNSNTQKQLNYYIENLQNALIKEKADFVGIIYSGLIITNEGIKVLEYNVRLGDPETQPLLMHLNTDLLLIFKYAIEKKLDAVKIDWKEGTSACVVLATKGYPQKPVTGDIIKNLDKINNDIQIFYAGVKSKNNSFMTNGGRVLSICKTSENPFPTIYKTCETITFYNKIFRNDIKIYDKI
ncbi:MAG: phosphoribosylamine--glycine ligase [Candidatus Gastranaerophilales bacterium]|nr:phosphoribosylamine--glycine ligase [Candidatus Gastranaerophilales bacterium]